jgi:hypothetical protein
MELKKFFTTDSGKTIISIILGLGLATLFRKNCEGKNCFEFIAPTLDDINKKMYKYGKKCFNYEIKSINCDDRKKSVYFA